MKKRGSFEKRFDIVVIGTSAGGMTALGELLPQLPVDYPLPVVMVQHMPPSEDSYYCQYLDRACRLPVREAEPREPVRPAHIYVAPANYHLLLERDGTFALTVDERTNYARPSIDILFESAARIWRQGVLGVLLTGGNHDGAAGMNLIRACGGATLVQDPHTAENPLMPRSAINAGAAQQVMTLEAIAAFLAGLQAHR